MEWLEVRAVSVKQAKEQALVHLGVHESDAEFEIISEPKTGLFGRLKEEARVRARIIPTPVRSKTGRSRNSANRRAAQKQGSTGSAQSPQKPQTGPTKSTKTGSSSSQARRGRKPGPAQESAGSTRQSPKPSRRPMRPRRKSQPQQQKTQSAGVARPTLLEQADIAEDFVANIADKLGLSVSFTRHDIDAGVLKIDVHGEGIGLLVGRRGVTAHAVDELVRTVLQRSGGSIRDGKIRVDIGGVRARRAEALGNFARQVADDVIDSGESFMLEPMSRFDRKIVHDAIGAVDGVSTRSHGHEPNRRVVLEPEGD